MLNAKYQGKDNVGITLIVNTLKNDTGINTRNKVKLIISINYSQIFKSKIEMIWKSIFFAKFYFIITEFNQSEWVFDISNGKAFIMWLFNEVCKN